MPLEIVEVRYPEPVKKVLRLNEPFRFVLRNPGKLKLDFTNGSPFADGAETIEDAAGGREFVAVNQGKFSFDCTLIEPGGKEHRIKGGGELEVGP
jgi:hypothetical protein